MSGALGVQNLEELSVFGARMIRGVVAASENGSVDFTDIQHLIPAAMAAPDAFDGASEALAELADLQSDEEQQIRNAVDKELGSGAYERVGRHVLLMGLHAAAAYAGVKAHRNQG